MVGVAQLVELRIVIPAVVGSSPIVHPSLYSISLYARVAELVDALDLGSSGVKPVRVRVSPLVPHKVCIT